MSSGHFFDNKQLTEKKQKEIRLKELAAQIKQAEEQVRDYSVFLCSVSPDQTMVELETLRGNLRWGTQEYVAVRNLSSSIRRSLDRCTSLDYRVRWEQIANVADDVSAAATGRRAESNLEIVRGRGSASPPQQSNHHDTALYRELIEKRASPGGSRPHRSFTPTSVTVAPTTTVEVLVESLARTSPSRGATASVQPSSSRRIPLLSPHKEVLENDARFGREETASRAEDYFQSVEATPLNAALDVPRSHSRSWLLPPPQLSADRDDTQRPIFATTLAPPAYSSQYQEYAAYQATSSVAAAVSNDTGFFDASPRRESSSGQPVEKAVESPAAVHRDNDPYREAINPPAVVPLSSHALAQREIRVLEQHYETKLDEAHANWRFERTDLVSKMEQMERLMREQHSLEKAELHKAWNDERVSLLRGQNELREELRESKEGTRELEDQMDKLKQIVLALQHRLETSEDRSTSLQEQHRLLHDTLSRAVAAAPSGLIARQPSRSPIRVVETAVGTATFTAPSTDALRSMGLIGVGDVSGLTSAIRSPTSDRDRFRRAGSNSSYETVSPGRTSPQSVL